MTGMYLDSYSGKILNIILYILILLHPKDAPNCMYGVETLGGAVYKHLGAKEYLDTGVSVVKLCCIFTIYCRV